MIFCKAILPVGHVFYYVYLVHNSYLLPFHIVHTEVSSKNCKFSKVFMGSHVGKAKCMIVSQ
jgi:hypothetical protein